MATIPLIFSISLTGTAMTLTIKSDPSYVDPGNANLISNFDMTLGYSSATATYVSKTDGPGYLVVPNSNGSGTLRLSGIDSQAGNGQPPGSVLATVIFTLNTAVSDFPLNITNFAFNNDAFTSGVADPTVPCFVKGTRLLSPQGNILVEELLVGDLLITLDGTPRAITWIGERRIACGAHHAPHNVLPVRVRAWAFGVGIPAQDVLLSPDHAVYVDGALIPARYLLNGATIVQEHCNEVTYMHVELEQHSIVFAEGLPTESYLDTGNRYLFDDETTTLVPLPSYALSVWAAKSCAPLVHSGEELVRARRLLLEQAAALGHLVTADPGLHLVVDGLIVQGTQSGSIYRFKVPANARTVRMRSRQFVPAYMLPWTDDYRELGVAVSRMVCDEVVSSGNGSGWYCPEPGMQWTDGDASICAGFTELSVTLVLLGTYWDVYPWPNQIESLKASTA